MRPARVQPRDFLSPSSKGTEATHRYAAPALAPRASLPDEHSTTQNRRPDLVIAQNHTSGRAQYSKREPGTAMTAKIIRDDEVSG